MTKYTLRQLLQIKNGRDYKDLKEGQIPVYGSGGYMLSVNKAIYEDESILLPRKGTLSNIQYVKKPFWTVDTLYYSIINKKKANVYYLYNYLRLLDLSRLNTGTGVPSMTFDLYYDLEVNLPELPTQQKIAAVLSALDDKIELNNKINAELEAMAKTLYDYWFVQFDFPAPSPSGKAGVGSPYKSSSGKMVYNATLKREIPEGWSASNILAFSDLCGGGTPSKKIADYWNGDIPFFTPTDSDGKVFKFRTEDYITKTGLKNFSSQLFNKGTIFLTARGSVGRLCITAYPMAMNQSCYALVPHDDIGSVYLYYLTEELIKHLQVKSSGSVFDSIVSNDIKFSNLIIPPKELIGKFSSIIKPMFDKISINVSENHELSALRDWLLPMLMNGQVSVGKVYEMVEEVLSMAAEGEVGYGK